MSAKVFQLSKFETRTAERCSQELKGFEYKTSEDWQAEFYKQGNGLELWENILALSRTCIVAPVLQSATFEYAKYQQDFCGHFAHGSLLGKKS